MKTSACINHLADLPIGDHEERGARHLDLLPGFSGTAHLAFENLGEWEFTVEHLVEIEPVHADDALAAPEGRKALFSEAAVADEQAAGPGGLLLDLAMEGVQLGDAHRLAVPLCLDKVGLASELEAPVDLLSPQPKRLLGREAKGVEQAFQESFEGIAARMRCERGDAKEVGLNLRDRLPIDRGRRRARRRTLG